MASSIRKYLCSYLLIVGLCFLQDVSAYPSGATTSSCGSMQPGHGEQSPNPCPFQVHFDREGLLSDETLELTLMAQESMNKTFKGFLIMGFDKATDAVIGTFKTTSNLSQTLDCANAYDTAVTHTSSNTLSSIRLLWTPPEDFNGIVQFKTTFSETKSIYWLKEVSQEIKITRVESNITSTTVAVPPTEHTPMPDVYAGCGNPGTKGCTGSPAGCIEAKNCLMMATYRSLNGELLELEVYGQSTGDNYVALGFSIDTRMGKDSVVECANYRNNLGAYQSFNAPGDQNVRLNPPLPEFSFKLGAAEDGYVYCRVQHPIVFSMSEEHFNLSNPYYLLMATGPTGANNIQRHTSIDVSSASVVPSTDLYIAGFEKPSTDTIRTTQYFKWTLKQLHGSFMVIAWLMASSIGTLLPVYMKKTWVGKQIMGKDRWFVYHQGLMLIAWSLTIAGFVIIFIDIGGWVSEPIKVNAHPLIGCITTGLAFVQPFMAMLRPLPGSPTRYMFNWAHSVFGNSAHILALTSIFLTVEMNAAELPYETYWILTAHACCYLGAHLFLNFFAKRNRRLIVETKDDSPKDEPGSAVRKAFLIVYSCVVVGLGTAVIVFIAGV